MKRGFRLAVLLSVATTPLAAQNPSPPAGLRTFSADDYYRIKDVEDAQISPEGAWVAYTVTTHDRKEDKDQERIWMVAVAGGEAIPLTAEGASSSHPRWSPDGKYLAFLSSRGEDKDDAERKKQVWALNRQGGEAQQLTDTIQDVEDFAWAPASDRLVLALQDPTPEEMEAAKNREENEKDEGPAKHKPRPWVIDRLYFKEDGAGYLDRRRKHLYVFTIADRKLAQITSGDYDDSEPAWSPDGRRIAFTSNRTEEPDRNFNTDIWTVSAGGADSGKPPIRVTANPGSDFSPQFSADSKWIAFASQRDPKLFWYATVHLAVAPTAGGQDQALTRALDRNVLALRFSADGQWIYFIVDDDGAQSLLRIPVTGGAISREIGGRRSVQSFSLAKDGTVAAAISEISRPSEIYVLPPGGELRKVTSTNDAFLKQLKLPEVDYVRFKSKDGTTVAGYLYKPVAYTPGQRYPAILRLHGGPTLSYQAEFTPDPQFYAANGYVVLTPNPRGSIGYGEDFCKAIFADWGNKDYQDDMAMVDYAIAQGLVDPEKLGVGGHSYGAISTNFIIAQTTRFKAAISQSGDFLNVTNWGHDEYVREWEYELGLPWENRALWEKVSSFRAATKIATPTLITGGDEDWNVPIINGEQMYETLKRLGVPTLLVVYPGEHHDFTRPSFIVDLRNRYLLWYNHYVKGEGPAAPPQNRSE